MRLCELRRACLLLGRVHAHVLHGFVRTDLLKLPITPRELQAIDDTLSVPAAVRPPWAAAAGFFVVFFTQRPHFCTGLPGESPPRYNGTGLGSRVRERAVLQEPLDSRDYRE